MENNKDNKIIVRKKGKVVSKSGDKTVVVSVDTYKTHSKYQKKYQSTRRYSTHDEENKCVVGDVVEIVNCSPISKNKRYKIKEKI